MLRGILIKAEYPYILMENEYMFSPIRWGRKNFDTIMDGNKLAFLYPMGGGIPVYRATWGVGGGRPFLHS